MDARQMEEEMHWEQEFIRRRQELDKQRKQSSELRMRNNRRLTETSARWRSLERKHSEKSELYLERLRTNFSLTMSISGSPSWHWRLFTCPQIYHLYFSTLQMDFLQSVELIEIHKKIYSQKWFQHGDNWLPWLRYSKSVALDCAIAMITSWLRSTVPYYINLVINLTAPISTRLMTSDYAIAT